MKKIAFLPITLLLCAGAFAAPADISTLRAYAKKATLKCPDAIMTLEPMPKQGPLNFSLFDLNVKSAEESCTEHKYLLYSPATQQVVIGTVFLIPDDGRPLATRLAAQTSELLHEPVVANIAPFPLPDGLKVATMSKSTQYGQFAYHGFVDASERFLIVGIRGNLMIDPGKTLKDAVGAEHAVTRGNPKAKTEIVELSDFECPTCGRAHSVIEPLISKNLSKVYYKRLDLPLFEHHQWSIYAALGAHAIEKVAPAMYWDYVDYIFKNQETIGKQPFDKVLENFCEDHDIAWAKVAPLYKSTAERQAILDGVSKVFDTGINSTPTFIINGQTMGYGKEGIVVLDAIRAAVK